MRTKKSLRSNSAKGGKTKKTFNFQKLETFSILTFLFALGFKIKILQIKH